MAQLFPLRTRLLDSDRGLTLDGGLASELDRAGYDLQHELWSARLLLEDPDAIAKVIRGFADAGADIVTTATYQATFPGLERIGLARAESVRLFQDAVALALRAVSESKSRPLVAASIGPYGAFLADGSEYRGKYGLTKTELADFHRERITVLADTEADLLAFETFPSGVEIEAIADVLPETPDREAWISCSCRNGKELWDGTPIVSVAERIHDHPQVTALGVNCVDPMHAVELISRIHAAAPDKSIIVYPNAGRGWDEEAGDWKGFDSPTEFAERATDWRKAGATIVGGCCQTTPEHIRALAESL